MARSSDPELLAAWRELLDLHRQSQLTVSEFCDSQDISSGAFYYWQRKTRQNHVPQMSPTADDSRSAFLPVQVESRQNAQQDRSGRPPAVIIDLPDTTRIQVPVADHALVLAAITALAGHSNEIRSGDQT